MPLWLVTFDTNAKISDEHENMEMTTSLTQNSNSRRVIKMVSKAEELAEQLEDFSKQYGHEELSLALSKVSNLLHQINLRNPKSQTSTITDFFSHHIE